MPGRFDSGLDRGIIEPIGGLIASILFSVFISSGLTPYYFIWIFHLYNIYGMISLIKEMTIWKTSYIAGWLVGVFILAYSGLIGIDFLIYLLPLVILALRFFSSIRS